MYQRKTKNVRNCGYIGLYDTRCQLGRAFTPDQRQLQTPYLPEHGPVERVVQVVGRHGIVDVLLLAGLIDNLRSRREVIGVMSDAWSKCFESGRWVRQAVPASQ